MENFRKIYEKGYLYQNSYKKETAINNPDYTRDKLDKKLEIISNTREGFESTMKINNVLELENAKGEKFLEKQYIWENKYWTVFLLRLYWSDFIQITTNEWKRNLLFLISEYWISIKDINEKINKNMNGKRDVKNLSEYERIILKMFKKIYSKYLPKKHHLLSYRYSIFKWKNESGENNEGEAIKGNHKKQPLTWIGISFNDWDNLDWNESSSF